MTTLWVQENHIHYRFYSAAIYLLALIATHVVFQPIWHKMLLHTESKPTLSTKQQLSGFFTLFYSEIFDWALVLDSVEGLGIEIWGQGDQLITKVVYCWSICVIVVVQKWEQKLLQVNTAPFSATTGQSLWMLLTVNTHHVQIVDWVLLCYVKLTRKHYSRWMQRTQKNQR